MARRSSLVYFADPRFPGGTSRAFAAELAALDKEGIVPGFCPVFGTMMRGPHAMHPSIEKIVNTGQVALIDPREAGTASLAVVHHPRLFEDLPAQPIALRPDKVILVVHHPPFGGRGQPEYDLERIVRNLREVFVIDPIIAPVGPTVRKQLARGLPAGCSLLAEDWLNLLDLDKWCWRPPRPPGRALIVGRHSRPQLSKWPDGRDEGLQVYPECDTIRFRALGTSDEIEQQFAPLPANWRFHPFAAEGVQAFLKGLDVYVYYHGSDWVEAFGMSILEALATGLPTILPPDFKALFGPAAIYSEPSGVIAELERLRTDKSAYVAQAETARREVERRFGLEGYCPRLDRVAPNWREPLQPARVRQRRVLFMTSNGIGLGHLTRAMAVARRLPGGTETAILTLSQAFKLAVDQGFLTQFIPHHGLTGANATQWNAALAREVSNFLTFFRPDTLVFDGNGPYQGLLDALDGHPDVKRVWMRRALWAEWNADLIARSQAFDLIIEPEEFSGRFDQGPTRDGRAILVPPILYCSPEERFERAEAREALGVPQDGLVVALMLGAGNNFSFQDIRERIVEHLSRRSDVTLVEFLPPIARETGQTNAHRTSSLYPAFQWSRGLDAIICSAGYNSFHECLIGGIPALFVANEAREMDLQIVRARHASRIGCARMLRAGQRIGIGQELDALLDAANRAEMQDRLSRLDFGDGAGEAARMVHQASFVTRCARELAR